MDVKPGYKQTEVGVIPEEWNVFQLSEHFRIYAGGDVPKHSVSNFRSETHPYPIFANALQDRGLYGFTGERRAKADSVTVTARGYLGHAEYRDEPFFPIVRLLVLEPNGDLDPRFTTFAINERVKFAFESTGVPQLTAPQIGKYAVAAPPLPEQRAIAAALSDVDGLLGGLDRLIAKKRDLKQAAMQQLLTGQTRLPGFHGEWEVKTLGEVFKITAGKSKSGYVVPNGDFWVCDMGSVSIEGRLIVSKQTNYRADFLKLGDLIMPKDDIGGGNIIGKVGYIDANHTYILSDHVYCLRALEGDPRFLAYVINSHRVNSKLRKKVIGSAQLGLGRKSVTEQEIPFPAHAEQTAIAEVLSEMDGELGKLEERREKTRALKQAMMQELLTGRTRLV